MELIPHQKKENPDKISLSEFLDVYKAGNAFAITTDQETQAYIVWTEDDKEYTHPACDEVPIREYIDFMIELRRLRFDRHPRRQAVHGYDRTHAASEGSSKEDS